MIEFYCYINVAEVPEYWTETILEKCIYDSPVKQVSHFLMILVLLCPLQHMSPVVGIHIIH
jgi:hypothetical protein